MNECVEAARVCAENKDAVGYGILAIAAVLLVGAARNVRDMFSPASPDRQIRRDGGTDGGGGWWGIGDDGCDGDGGD